MNDIGKPLKLKLGSLKSLSLIRLICVSECVHERESRTDRERTWEQECQRTDKQHGG